MKITIETSLPADADIMDVVGRLRGDVWRSAVGEFLNQLRSTAKHTDGPQAEYAADMRRNLYELLEQYDLRVE
jgi:hypothetical protein